VAADLIFYGLIAAGLVFWLRSVLGTRHGDERERPSPFSISIEIEDASDDNGLALSREPEPKKMIAEMLENRDGVMAVENKTAEAGLLDILEAEREEFDIKRFLQGSQDAFVMIVEAFAQGDREALGDLLDEKVYKAFEGAITEREEKGEDLFTEVHAVRKSEVIEARLEGKTAYITVRFVADETRVLRDDGGEILEGHPDRVSEVRDIWTFSKPVRSRDPRWLLVETRGDFEGDNDYIPDTE